MTGTALANYDEAWAKLAAQAAAENAVTGGTFLSTRGGILSFNDEPMPGNQAAVIVLDSIRENTYYTDKFDPDMPASPKCYAFGRTDDEMAPHPTMQVDLNYFEPQSADCATCPHHAWGTADLGRGKACQERRRLALLPAGVYSPRKGSRDFDLNLVVEPEHYTTADVTFLKLPVTSVKGWSQYVASTAALYHRPFAGVITRVFAEPHPKFQYQVKFEFIDLVPDELAQIVMARIEQAQASIAQGYSAPKAE